MLTRRRFMAAGLGVLSLPALGGSAGLPCAEPGLDLATEGADEFWVQVEIARYGNDVNVISVCSQVQGGGTITTARLVSGSAHLGDVSEQVIRVAVAYGASKICCEGVRMGHALCAMLRGDIRTLGLSEDIVVVEFYPNPRDVFSQQEHACYQHMKSLPSGVVERIG